MITIALGLILLLTQIIKSPVEIWTNGLALCEHSFFRLFDFLAFPVSSDFDRTQLRYFSIDGGTICGLVGQDGMDENGGSEKFHIFWCPKNIDPKNEKLCPTLAKIMLSVWKGRPRVENLKFDGEVGWNLNLKSLFKVY